MTIEQILEEYKELSIDEIVRRISAPFPHDERFAQLSYKSQEASLTDEERREFMEIIWKREEENVGRVKMAMTLGRRQGRPSADVYEELVKVRQREIFARQG